MRFLGKDLALDIGAASTQIYVRRRGIVLNEPSVVIKSGATGKVVAYGADTPTSADPVAIRPISGGMPVDSELTRRLIRHFLRKVHGHPFSKPRMVIALPDESAGLAGGVLRDMAFRAEARQVYLVQHGLAAALGAGLPVREPGGHMVIDIGCDTTRIAVLSCGTVVSAVTVQAGGAEVNRAIAAQVKRDRGLVIGDHAAELAKRQVGTAWKPQERHTDVHGHEPGTGRTGTVSISSAQIYHATRLPVSMIVRAAARTIEGCSPDLAADVAHRGAVLTGGGSLMRGLTDRLNAELGIPVRRAERPVEAVALGLGRCVDELGLLPRAALVTHQ